MKFSTFAATVILVGGTVFGGAAGAAFVTSQDANMHVGVIGISDPNFIDVDFRDGTVWGSGSGNHTITRSVYGSTVDATVTAWDGLNNPGSLWWNPNDGDGYGVRGGENDEIDRTEFMTVEFTDRVLLLGVFLTDLFDNRNDGPSNGDSETALVQLYLDGVGLGSEYAFQSGNNLTTQDNNGGYYGAFGTPGEGIVVNSIRFRSTGLGGDEFSVAGFSGSALSVVPLPAALPLYGTGLAVMGLIGWRRKRKASA